MNKTYLSGKGNNHFTAVTPHGRLIRWRKKKTGCCNSTTNKLSYQHRASKGRQTWKKEHLLSASSLEPVSESCQSLNRSVTAVRTDLLKGNTSPCSGGWSYWTLPHQPYSWAHIFIHMCKPSSHWKDNRPCTVLWMAAFSLQVKYCQSVPGEQQADVFDSSRTKQYQKKE